MTGPSTRNWATTDAGAAASRAASAVSAMATAAGLSPDGTPPAGDRSPAVVDLDNRLRRSLRVGNPWSAAEIVEAFGRRYPDALVKLQRERAGETGAAGTVAVQVTPVERTVSVSLGTEVAQAMDDVRQDLQALTADSLLKDVAPELRGWSTAIHAAVAEGLAAARSGMDPRSRDRAFAARRLLGDYARLARYVGVLTPAANRQYRQLAVSLDEVGGIILVLLGESLANAGHGGTQFLLQVPASELTQRRDAVIHALRNLLGATQQAFGPQEWPRGLHAYRDLVDRIEDSGHGDLLALLEESHLTRILDDLVERAVNPTSESLRGVGSTAPTALASIRRLLQLARGIADPESPPLSALLLALELFADGFESARSQSGSRLLFIARPPIMLHGLYGIGDPGAAARRLLGLTIARGVLAEYADCFVACGCGTEAEIRRQILLDKALYDVDRTIDLYAQGTDPNAAGEPEVRAGAYGFVLDQLDAVAPGPAPVPPPHHAIRELLWWDREPRFAAPVGGGNLTLVDENGNTATIAGVPACSADQLPHELTNLANRAQAQGVDPNRLVNVPTPLRRLIGQLEIMQDEICAQDDSETRWLALVRTMAPTCVQRPGVVGDARTLPVTRALTTAALGALGGQACPDEDITIPPTVETSFDSLLNRVARTGRGRARIRRFP